MKFSYDYYKNILKSERLPLAFVDLDLLEVNANDIISRSGDKSIRIASKSIRCFEVLKRIFEYSNRFKGIMCFTPEEAVFLAKKGFDDLMVAYPGFQNNQIKEVCWQIKEGKHISLMFDSTEHLRNYQKIAQSEDIELPVWIDIDMSMPLPGLHFGVHRSPVKKPEHLDELIGEMKKSPNLKWIGLMGYEAQIAGVGDNYKGQTAKNLIIKGLKQKSIRRVKKWRELAVEKIRKAGFEMPFVNGGGTGSLESTKEETLVTEVTAGSGFYSSALFDNYSSFLHKPAAGFAIEVVRKPGDGMFTCHGGGYVASGATGADKCPKPYLPAGMRLTANEGTGEVQTPLKYSGIEVINMGDPVFFRHSKAGELCERFTNLILISSGKIIDKVPTYRGEGQCFL